MPIKRAPRRTARLAAISTRPARPPPTSPCTMTVAYDISTLPYTGDPAVTYLHVGSFDRGPGDAVGRLLALDVVLVRGKGGVERRAVDVLGVRRQMRLQHRCRKIGIARIRHVLALSFSRPVSRCAPGLVCAGSILERARRLEAAGAN